MRDTIRACCGVVALCFGFSRSAAAEEPAPPAFQAGFAERDITPSIGMEAPGGYGKSYHRQIHDPCKVRAAVFGDGANRVALVGLDALFVRRQVAAAARQAIQEKCGIEPQCVMIAASHSHSAGPMGMILPGEYDDASPLVKSLAYEKSSNGDPKYLDHVRQQIVDAVCAADAGKVPARCGVGAGVEDQVTFNRRFRMRNGLTYTHPNPGNPEIVEPAGPIDPQVGVIGAWDLAGKPLGAVVNFACHATTSPGGASADYVMYLEQVVRGLMGSDAVVVFLNGASGDVTQVDNRTPYQVKQFGETFARRVGGRVGAEAVKVLVSMEPGALAPVKGRSTVLKIKRRVPKPERVAKALELVQQTSPKPEPTEWSFAKETLLLDALVARAPIADVETQAIQVGPAVFLACPAEYFCQYGLDLEAGSGFPFTFPVSLANDCVGYVPTEEALGERGGGYETRLTSYSNLEPTAGSQIARSLVELARGWQPGPVPALPRLSAEQRVKPWSYGNVPPELE